MSYDLARVGKSWRPKDHEEQGLFSRPGTHPIRHVKLDDKIMANDFVCIMVDRQHSIRKIISRFLREMASSDEINLFHEIIEAQDAGSALELFGRITKEIVVGANDIPISLDPQKVIVLCEVEPENSENQMSGFQLYKLCMMDDNFYDFSFIMMLDDPTMDVISDIGELGAIDILVKPLTFNNLSRLVKRVQERINSKEQSLYKMAERLINKNEYAKALDLIARSEIKFPGLKWVILRGKAHLGLSQTKSAEDEFCSVKISAHMASVIALSNLVEVYQATGDIEKAIEVLNELTQKSPKNLTRRLKLAELLTEADRQSEAKEVLDSLAEMNPGPETHIAIANLLEKNGYGEEAGDLRAKLIGQNLEDFVLCNRMAIELRKQSQHEKAESCYQEIVAVHPDQYVIWFNRGINYGAWGNSKRDLALLEKAKDCFRRVLRLNPQFASALDMLEALQNQMKKLVKTKMNQVA